jgi:hypothetical protein
MKSSEWQQNIAHTNVTRHTDEDITSKDGWLAKKMVLVVVYGFQGISEIISCKRKGNVKCAGGMKSIRTPEKLR